jgi:hypothetical protein
VDFAEKTANGAESATIVEMTAHAPAGNGREIRSEPRGPHWVAWVVDAAGKPLGSVVLVGETREEAEERARKWGEQA